MGKVDRYVPVVRLCVHDARIEAHHCSSRGTPLQPDPYPCLGMVYGGRRQQQAEAMLFLEADRDSQAAACCASVPSVMERGRKMVTSSVKIC